MLTKNHCPIHLIARFQETFPGHTPICDAQGELTHIWNDAEDTKERGGITDAMFDLFESFITYCLECGGNGTNALHSLCFSCENEKNRRNTSTLPQHEPRCGHCDGDHFTQECGFEN